MGIGMISYGILLLLFAAFALFYVEFSAVQVFLMACIIPVFMFAIVRMLKRNIGIEATRPMSIVEKETIDGEAEIVFRLTISHVGKILPLLKGMLYIQYENSFAGIKGREKIRFSVDCGEEKTQEIFIKMKKIGDVKITFCKVKIYDYLSLFSATLLKKMMFDNVLVLPPLKECYLDEALFELHTEESNKFSPYVKGEDPSEVFGIREFTDGDKLQSIHWKLSQKRQTLMVKEFSLPLAEDLAVFIDLAGEETDRLVQGIYSISMALLEKEITQKVIWYDCVKDQIRKEIVSKEEELFWMFQELFKTKMGNNPEVLPIKFSEWNQREQIETALYLTVSQDYHKDGSTMHVRNLRIMNLREEEETQDERKKSIR